MAFLILVRAGRTGLMKVCDKDDDKLVFDFKEDRLHLWETTHLLAWFSESV